MNSKSIKLFIILFSNFLFIPTVLESGIRIVEFHARRENNIVILEWSTEEEFSLLKFNIERSTDNKNWIWIGEKYAYGNGESSTRQTYEYTDDNIFKRNLTNFYYRLIIVEKDGSTTPYNVIASARGISGIKHTWGSIKAMFR